MTEQRENCKIYEQLIKEMKEEIGDNLVSVVKFGSEGEPNNLLLVLNRLDFDVLNDIKPVVIKHRKKGFVVPLLFTKEELFDGADVFPLEFLDIKQPHKTVYGEEIIDKIKLNKKHVRRQLEFEFRSKLIHLRENYIWIKHDKELKDLLISAVPTLMPLFYGLLFLKGIKAPTNLDGLFRLVAKNYKVNLDILKRIKKIKEEKLKTKKEELREYVKELIGVLADLGEIVDEMKI
ncbi:hypothetical protein ISS05_02855 [Candidatus Woesearchaeota archaeon]|nr:hypothetical protein [Candidatus Woesearchaeota archaeon]